MNHSGHCYLNELYSVNVTSTSYNIVLDSNMSDHTNGHLVLYIAAIGSIHEVLHMYFSLRLLCYSQLTGSALSFHHACFISCQILGLCYDFLLGGLALIQALFFIVYSLGLNTLVVLLIWQAIFVCRCISDS